MAWPVCSWPGMAERTASGALPVAWHLWISASLFDVAHSQHVIYELNQSINVYSLHMAVVDDAPFAIFPTWFDLISYHGGLGLCGSSWLSLRSLIFSWVPSWDGVGVWCLVRWNHRRRLSITTTQLSWDVNVNFSQPQWSTFELVGLLEVTKSHHETAAQVTKKRNCSS